MRMRGSLGRTYASSSNHQYSLYVVAVREAWGVDEGDRMLIWCNGGPAICRAVSFPPPLEISIDEGIYVLVDDANASEQWSYEFVTD